MLVGESLERGVGGDEKRVEGGEEEPGLKIYSVMRRIHNGVCGFGIYEAPATARRCVVTAS